MLDYIIVLLMLIYIHQRSCYALKASIIYCEFFWLAKRYLWKAPTLSHEKKTREECCCCYYGYLLVIVASHGIHSARSIDLARASHTYTFRCHFVRVTIELDVHIRPSYFIVSLPLVDHQKDRNIDINRLTCIRTEIHETYYESIYNYLFFRIWQE